VNHVYEKRIKSYLEFLWKNQFAHNIYIKLDLAHHDISNRNKKLKAYVATGNNGAMVRGLLKRRYWWELVDEISSDCQLVWTQSKVNEIFRQQKKHETSKSMYKKADK
jgi:hypothetical protein